MNFNKLEDLGQIPKCIIGIPKVMNDSTSSLILFWGCFLSGGNEALVKVKGITNGSK